MTLVDDDVKSDRRSFSFTVSPRSGGDRDQVTGKYLWLLRRTTTEPWRITRLIVSRDAESDEHAADGVESESTVQGA